MSLAAVGSGQHFNIPASSPPGTPNPVLYFRYAPNLYAFMLLLLGVK